MKMKEGEVLNSGDPPEGWSQTTTTNVPGCYQLDSGTHKEPRPRIRGYKKCWQEMVRDIEDGWLWRSRDGLLKKMAEIEKVVRAVWPST